MSITLKRHLAVWLRRWPPLRWLLALGVRIWVPRHYVGAVGVIFNKAGQVLLMEHVFRPHYPWGLPGGWVEHGEDPADTVRREVKEELGWPIEVKALVLCQLQGGKLGHSVPLGLGLVYYCRLYADLPELDLAHLQQGHEILSLAWVDPAAIPHRLSPLENDGIAAAKRLFDQTEKTL